jgi:hypothetical protein
MGRYAALSFGFRIPQLLVISRQGLIGFVDREVENLQVITEDGETFDEIKPGRKGSFVLLIEPGMTVEGTVGGCRVPIRSEALS